MHIYLARSRIRGRSKPQICLYLIADRIRSARVRFANPAKRSRLQEIGDQGEELSAGGHAEFAIRVFDVSAQRLQRYPKLVRN